MKEFLLAITSPPWIYIIGLVVPAATFYWKLNTDAKYARYRETIAFIEKREEDMRKRWSRIRDHTIEFSERAEDVYHFMSQLELISLLVKKKAFDEELVYNFWWRYFDEPLRIAALNTWLLVEQESDRELFAHYLEICRRWTPRIDREQGRNKLP